VLKILSTHDWPIGVEPQSTPMHRSQLCV